MIITIENEEYEIRDTKEKITVPDCFVVPANKIGGGHGEAKFYVGNDNSETRDFFGSEGFNIKCIVLKKDLLEYLEQAKAEYKNPEQEYHKKPEMPELWEKRLDNVKDVENELFFELSEQTHLRGPRIYVNSRDKAYHTLRTLSLPNITYISVMKLVRILNGEIIYYFKLFIDYYGEYEHPTVIQDEEQKIIDQDIEENEKLQLTRARIGQGIYRKALLEECPFCPITLIGDDRLLIASHIKPWVKSNNFEKTDAKNGFMLTPTYDFLFDRGYISFTNDKKLMISPWLSKMTCSKLNIAPDKLYPMLIVSGREEYLDYHRNYVFKK